MFFLMRCDHHPGMDGARDRLRPAHRDWNRSGGAGRVSVIHGSALWDDAGVAIGHCNLYDEKGRIGWASACGMAQKVRGDIAARSAG